MPNELPYGIVAALQERAITVLTGTSTGNSLLPKIISKDRTLKQLLEDTKTDPDAVPHGLQLHLLDLFRFLNFSDLLASTDASDGRPLPDLVRSILDKLEIDIKELVTAKNPANVLAALRGTFAGRNDHGLMGMVEPFIGRQFGVVLSLVTTLKNLVSEETPKRLSEAIVQYFFGKDGYQTVDGLTISPPLHIANVNDVKLDRVKDLLSERTADRYVRDLTRVIVEAGADLQYDLRRRYKAVIDSITPDTKRDNAIRWGKGFAAWAESMVTSAVEEATLGVAQFQTNPLLAASAGTFAGIAARKAAQHVFLGEIE
jgi:hypothetical protein